MNLKKKIAGLPLPQAVFVNTIMAVSELFDLDFDEAITANLGAWNFIMETMIEGSEEERREVASLIEEAEDVLRHG